MRKTYTLDDAARATLWYTLLVVWLEVRGVLPPVRDADLVTL